MWPGSGVLGMRRIRSGPQLGPGIQNVAWEWCFGSTKNTKWLTVGSGHSKCGLGVVFCWLRAVKMWLLAVKMGSPPIPAAPVRHLPRPPWGVMAISFEPTRNLSVVAVR
eukprot:2534730-Pyramimonas_sp.AAC.1